MSTLAKAFVVLNLILILVFVTVTGVLFSTHEDWKYKAARFEADLNAKSAELDALQASTGDQIAELQRKNVDLKNALDDKEHALAVSQNEVKKLNIDNDNLREANQKLQIAYESLDQRWQVTEQGRLTTVAELDRRTAELRRVMEGKAVSDEEVVRLTSDLGEANRTVDRLKDQVTEMDAGLGQKVAMLDRVRGIAPTVYQQALEDTRGGVIVPPIDGKVEAVDDGTNIVLLTVGREDKVERDMKFIIYRGPEYVGEVVVDEVFAQKCSARITLIRLPIQVGDEASTRIGS